MQNNIRKIIIVDDEQKIGLLINQLIHWDELNMSCQAIYDNSETALNEIISNPPDIVLTDIRMPKIDGLDLIRETLNRGLHIRFIIISGYKEFEYAHKALEYGVEDYLFKPIKEVEVNSALQDVKEKLNQYDQHRKMQLSIKESEKIIKRDLLNRIMDNKEPTMPNLKNQDITGSAYIAIDVKLDNIYSTNNDLQQNQLVSEKVTSIIEDQLNDVTEELLISEKPGFHLYCVMRYIVLNTNKVHDSLTKVLIDIKSRLSAYDQYYITIGVGNEHTFQDIRLSITEAYHSVCNRIVIGTDRIIYANSLRSFFAEDIDRYLVDAKEVIYKSIDSNNVNQLNLYVTSVYCSISDISEDYTVYYLVADYLMSLFFDYIQSDLGTNEKERQNLYIKCQNCIHKTEFIQTLKEGFTLCLDSANAEEQNKLIKPIRLTKEYIEKNYNQKLTLDFLAEYVNLSPAYFSSLFKKETGMNLMNYITEVRIENAKKLLQTTNETIAAIGSSVGFSDQRYFSKTFQKIVGIKPILYRRLHS